MKFDWVKLEHAFDMSHLYPGLFGTCDAVAYRMKDRLLRVVDYKHGSGHYVEVEGNEQLQYYALGALLTIPGLKVDWVELVIVQPRCPRKDGVIHNWKIPMTDMIDFAMSLLQKARATEDPNAPLKEGSWCWFCPAVGFCPAQHEKRIGKAQEQFKAVGE